MKVHFEAVLISQAEGVIDLEPDEIAEYGALTTDEERNEWLRLTVYEYARDEIHFSEVDNATWRIDDEDEEADS